MKYIANYFDIYDEFKLDISNYEILENEFLGNTGRYIGQFNIGTDTFLRIIPKYETLFTYGDGREYFYNEEEGSFVESIMKHMDKNADNCYHYYVCDYMDYGKRIVSFDNLYNSSNTNILVISYSQGYEIASYLALLCDKLTLIEPHFGGNTSLLLGNYNKVLVVGGGTHYGQYEFTRSTYSNAEGQIVDIDQQSGGDFVVTVCNTGDGIWNEKNQIRMLLYHDGIDTGKRYNIEEGVNIPFGGIYRFTIPIEDFDLGVGKYSVGMLQEGVKYFDNPKEIMTIEMGEESS